MADVDDHPSGPTPAPTTGPAIDSGVEAAAMAAAIHDGPLQLLGAALLRIELCRRHPTAHDPAQLDQVADLVAEAVADLRAVLGFVAPPPSSL